MSRKIGEREPNHTYLILVEGSTEKVYFENLKAQRNQREGKKKDVKDVFTVKRVKNGKPVPILNKALKEHTAGEHQTIWCVYDCDILHRDNIEKQFSKEYNKCTQLKEIQFAESMPCFEVWFILHFDKPQHYYQDSKAVEKDLKKHIPNYDKNQEWQRKNLSTALQGKMIEALDRVSELPEINHDKQDTATSVHKLVEIFCKE